MRFSAVPSGDPVVCEWCGTQEAVDVDGSAELVDGTKELRQLRAFKVARVIASIVADETG